MRVTIVQSRLHWENPETNRKMFEEKLGRLSGATDLVVLPEMFTTGFSMNAAELAETMDGDTVQWMRSMASDLQAAITGSFICAEGDQYYNRLLWVFPDGRTVYYDKRHLFMLAGEHQQYTRGEGRVVINWKGWRICPLICYDLRFPEWSRNTPETYDLLIYVANWPAARAHHWRSLLAARAIENQSYVVGVNIVGEDGAGLEYRGDSMVIDYGGQPLGHMVLQEGRLNLDLSLVPLRHFRQQLPFLADAQPGFTPPFTETGIL